MKKEIKTCDIENRPHGGEILTRRVQVVFNHDQEDGKSSVKPYLQWEDIEMCEDCYYAQMIAGRQYVSGYGAMGHNKYFFVD